MNLAPGDTVWILRRNEGGEPYEADGFVFVAANQECVICAYDPNGYDGTISQYLIERSKKKLGMNVFVFPLIDACASKDEAKKALRG